MTKEYLKMADYFAGEIDQDDIVILDCGLDTISHAPEEAAAHAINSHDELVAEVERLRESNKRMAASIWSNWMRCGMFAGSHENRAAEFNEQYLCAPPAPLDDE